VRVELQADCLAGVWAHSMDQRNLLRDGDLASALKAAAAVGDDFIAKAAGQPTDPDNFSHGTSAQRQRWLTTGFEKGTPDACDTFAGNI
jgi:predicted metalloprotease